MFIDKYFKKSHLLWLRGVCRILEERDFFRIAHQSGGQIFFLQKLEIDTSCSDFDFLWQQLA